uniref:Uncharacterized protein n=1 Tax=Steinernema glaseri TaxID=37863 RepID=A0A1I7ZDQ0_9BILA
MNSTLSNCKFKVIVQALVRGIGTQLLLAIKLTVEVYSSSSFLIQDAKQNLNQGQGPYPRKRVNHSLGSSLLSGSPMQRDGTAGFLTFPTRRERSGARASRGHGGHSCPPRTLVVPPPTSIDHASVARCALPQRGNGLAGEREAVAVTASGRQFFFASSRCSALSVDVAVRRRSSPPPPPRGSIVAVAIADRAGGGRAQQRQWERSAA